MKFWLDGRCADAVPGDDRGLTLGDGHFTTMLVQHGQVVLWHRHRQRLAEANARLGFADPDWEQVKAEVDAACQNEQRACLRLTLTRGSAGRGYQGAWAVQPRRLMTLSPFPQHYRQWQQQGVAAEVANTTLATGGALVGLKTLGRLEQVLLKQEAATRGVSELIVTDGAGYLVEASASNLFLVTREGQVITPKLQACGIAGVMRAEVMAQLAQSGQPVLERAVAMDELPKMSEAFITNALMGVVPLTRIGAVEMPGRAVAESILEKQQLWR